VPAVWILTALALTTVTYIALRLLRRRREHTSAIGNVVGSPALQVRRWATGRECALCGVELNARTLKRDHVALLDPGGRTRDRRSVTPADLPLALATCLPVCWNCHLAESFRRKHPDLVTERDDQVMQVKRQTSK
jgi:hypothetical protein